ALSGRAPHPPFAGATTVSPGNRADLPATRAVHRPGVRQPVAGAAEAPAGVVAERSASGAHPWGAGNPAHAAPAEPGGLSSVRTTTAGARPGYRRFAHTGGSDRAPRRGEGRIPDFPEPVACAVAVVVTATGRSRTSSSLGSQSSTEQMTCRLSRRIEIGVPDHRYDIF